MGKSTAVLIVVLTLALAGCSGELKCWSTGQAGSGASCQVEFECSDGVEGWIRGAPDGDGCRGGDCVACYTNNGDKVSQPKGAMIFIYCDPDPRGSQEARDFLAMGACATGRTPAVPPSPPDSQPWPPDMGADTGFNPDQ